MNDDGAVFPACVRSDGLQPFCPFTGALLMGPILYRGQAAPKG